MIQGVIFDADGTLLDSMGIWEEVGPRYLRRRGFEPEDGLSAKLFPLSLEEGCQYLKERYALPQSENEIRDGILAEIEIFYRQEVQPKPGVEAFLQSLQERGIPMVIATAGSRVLLEAALSRLGIRPYFARIITCQEAGADKRDAAIYHMAAQALQTEISGTIVLEDVLFALETAKKAGFLTIAVEDSTSCNDRENIRQMADWYITDFNDLDSFWKFASAL